MDARAAIRAVAGGVLLCVSVACAERSVPTRTTGALSPTAETTTRCDVAAKPADSPSPPGLPPPLSLRAFVVPAVGLARPAGWSVDIDVTLDNDGAGPIELPLLLPLTLHAWDGELVRTFPGKPGPITLRPGSRLWSGAHWDQRRDDGTPARPGRYFARLNGLPVRHAGSTSTVTMKLEPEPVVVVDPVGGVRDGFLPLGLSATDHGVTLRLDRLVMRRLEAHLEAHVVPPLTNAANVPVNAEYRLGGGPPAGIRSPAVGQSDASRTSLTWVLDAVPRMARDIDLCVNITGDVPRSWRLGIPLPAATPEPPPPTPVPPKP